MARRLIATAPGPARTPLERSLARILDGSWTARRWLDERSGTARRRRLATAGAAAGLIAVGALATVLVRPALHRPLRSTPLGGASIAIGWGMPGRLDSVRALTLDADFVGRPAPLAALPAATRQGLYPSMVRPDLKAAAVACYLPDADPTAICLRDLATGVTTTLARFDADAAPVGWLPDGSALIVLRGWATRSGGYGHELLLVDTSGRVIRTITRDSTAYDGAWSAPLGDRILVLRSRERRSEAAIIDLSGRVLSILDWCDRSAKATWSPDGRRLACLLEDNHELRIGDAEPLSTPAHVTLPGSAESGPIWSADGRFVAVSAGGRAPGVYVVDREGTMAPRLVASYPAPPRLVAWMAPGGMPPLHKLNIDPDSLVVVVGSTRTLEARGLGPGGQQLGPQTVHWRSDDSSIVRVTGDGLVIADRPGRTTVIAGIGLDRVDDTAYVRVDSAPARLLVEETFEHGLDPARWRSYGTPAPALLSGAGRNGSTGLLNRGTYAHTSGIALRNSLSLDRGLTVEYWAQIPVTRPQWQSVKVGLYAVPADSFHRTFAPEPAPSAAAVSLEAPNPNDARRQMMAVVTDAGASPRFVELPRSLADGAWHRYRLVAYPGGELRWFADGIEVMPPARASSGGRVQWTLVIAGRSVGTLAMVDDFKVWEGVVLDPVQPARASGRRALQGRKP